MTVPNFKERILHIVETVKSDREKTELISDIYVEVRAWIDTQPDIEYLPGQFRKLTIDDILT